MYANHDIAPPAAVTAVYGGWRRTAVSVYPQQVTWRLERDTTVRYLKVGAVGNYPSLRAEAERTNWAAAHLPVPAVVDVGGDGTFEWLVTTAVDGCPAGDRTVGDVRTVVVALATGLRQFHERAPVSDCPFDFRVDAALEHVRRRVARGLVNPVEDFHDEHRHLDSPAAALHKLERLCPTCEDLVVCHGDYCPPNALIHAGQVVGYVDLGELAIADRWCDLAVATWSTTWTFGPGLESVFLDTYGAELDPDRQAFYRLLFDVAS